MENQVVKSEHIITSQEESIDEKVQLILRQTNYTEEIAKEKLLQMNEDPIRVIKDFLGIQYTKSPKIAKSRNQEIYRQIREYIYVPPENHPKFNPASENDQES